MSVASTIIDLVKSSVTSSAIDAVVPQSLEVQAHSTTWSQRSPFELTLLKMLPSTPATQVVHEYAEYTSHSNRKVRFGTFNQLGLPVSSRFESARRSVTVALVGEKSEIPAAAALEKTLTVNGQQGAVNIENFALQSQVLGLKQQAMIFSDTTTTRLGANSDRPRGLIQQLRERTDGTIGPRSPFGSHVIDLKGKPLTQSTVREYMADIVTQFGAPNCLVMDPYARADFEASLDGSYMLPLPVMGQPYTLGQTLRGVMSNQQAVGFYTDNMLNPRHPLSSRGQYSTDLDPSAPSTQPTINSCVAASGSPTEWDAASAGEIFYLVCEVVNEIPGRAVRYPATADTYLTVAAGDVVTFSVTPGNPNADSFLVYRGTQAEDDADKQPFLAFEVANSNSGGAVTFYDRNYDRPGTSTALLLSINSDAQRAINLAPDFGAIDPSAFINQADDEVRNTVSLVHLGASMMQLDLARILPTVAQPLMFSVCVPQIRAPRQNFIFKNVGRP